MKQGFIFFFPQNIQHTFYCGYNQITSFENCPQNIQHTFICDNNYITSFEGYPQNILYGFYYLGNRLPFFKVLQMSLKYLRANSKYLKT